MLALHISQALQRIYILRNRKLTFALRLILGLTLLVFGVGKLTDLGSFIDTVISYKVLPEVLSRVYAVILPWMEVIIGSFLLIGLWLKFIAPISILVIISLIAGTLSNLIILGKEVSSCGCMPGLDWPVNIGHIIALFAMLAMAIQIWLHKGEFLSLDSKIFNIDKSG